MIKLPSVVQNATGELIGKFFTNQPQRDHAANDLTGLMISLNKTVAGMTGKQPNASDQSCLNFRSYNNIDDRGRLEYAKLNEERIPWLQKFNNNL